MQTFSWCSWHMWMDRWQWSLGLILWRSSGVHVWKGLKRMREWWRNSMGEQCYLKIEKLWQHYIVVNIWEEGHWVLIITPFSNNIFCSCPRSFPVVVLSLQILLAKITTYSHPQTSQCKNYLDGPNKGHVNVNCNTTHCNKSRRFGSGSELSGVKSAKDRRNYVTSYTHCAQTKNFHNSPLTVRSSGTVRKSLVIFWLPPHCPFISWQSASISGRYRGRDNIRETMWWDII